MTTSKYFPEKVVSMIVNNGVIIVATEFGVYQAMIGGDFVRSDVEVIEEPTDE